MQPFKKKKRFFNYTINVRTGFLDPKNMSKGTKIDFLSQILSKLWGIEYLAHLAQTAILSFAYMAKVAQGCWSGIFLILIHMIYQVNDVKYDMKSKHSLFHFSKCK